MVWGCNLGRVAEGMLGPDSYTAGSGKDGGWEWDGDIVGVAGAGTAAGCCGIGAGKVAGFWWGNGHGIFVEDICGRVTVQSGCRRYD